MSYFCNTVCSKMMMWDQHFIWHIYTFMLKMHFIAVRGYFKRVRQLLVIQSLWRSSNTLLSACSSITWIYSDGSRLLIMQLSAAGSLTAGLHKNKSKLKDSPVRPVTWKPEICNLTFMTFLLSFFSSFLCWYIFLL